MDQLVAGAYPKPTPELATKRLAASSPGDGRCSPCKGCANPGDRTPSHQAVPAIQPRRPVRHPPRATRGGGSPRASPPSSGTPADRPHTAADRQRGTGARDFGEIAEAAWDPAAAVELSRGGNCLLGGHHRPADLDLLGTGPASQLPGPLGGHRGRLPPRPSPLVLASDPDPHRTALWRDRD